MAKINAWIAAGAVMILGACASVSAQRTVYKVRVDQGDSLASIATKFGTSWQAIARDNAIRDSRDIYVGQILLVKPGPGGYVAKTDQPSRSEAKGQVGTLFKPAAPDTEVVPSPDSRPRADTITPPDSKGNERRGLFYGGSHEESSYLMWPVRGYVTSHFGWRRGRFHNGVDIMANKGTPIVASAEGRVSFAGRKRRYGNTVIIDHGSYRTLYAHCSRILVKVGQFVSRGAAIAKVGATGNARGYHLHFEYRDKGSTALNPLSFLRDLNT